jgi:GTPase SAR1 family protein
MQDKIRVQIDFGAFNIRIWVACLKTDSIKSLALLAESAYHKQTQGARVRIQTLSLRGALLDFDEVSGDWLEDQALLFAEGRLEEEGSAAAGGSSNGGVLVHHEPPLVEGLDLNALSPQVIILACLGQKGVGKSAFVKALDGKTAGGSSIEKKVEVDGVVHKLVVVDSDPEKEDAVFKTANAFLFLYDITSRESFQELQGRMLGLYVAARGHESSCPVSIISHKSDLSAERKVSVSESIQLAKELQSLTKSSVALFDASALNGSNVSASVQDTFLNVLQYRAIEAKKEEDGSSCRIA